MELTPHALATALGLPPPTDEQAEVIAAPARPALVVAGAGAGKTELGVSFKLPTFSIYRTTDKGSPRFDESDRFAVASDSLNDELVLVENIPVHSLCEHHMLPFVGVAHVGYLPGQRIVGLSKFARLVEFHARRAQTQERLTQEIAQHFRRRLEPRGVGVVIEAAHSCMSIRGARAPAARTVTSALLGRLRDDPASRAEFLSLARPSREVR